MLLAGGDLKKQGIVRRCIRPGHCEKELPLQLWWQMPLLCVAHDGAVNVDGSIEGWWWGIGRVVQLAGERLG